MRSRETKYASGSHVLGAVSWEGGWMAAWDAGKLQPKDMPDMTSTGLAELVDMWMTMALNRWEKLKDHLEAMPEAEE